MIIDLILTIASLGFVGADLRQAYKLFKNKKYNMSAFSIWHFRLKISSLVLVVIAYFMLGVFLALSVALSQLLLNVYISNRVGWVHKNA
jgi:hypothetical protein